MFFEKIHWAPSEVVEVKRSFSRSLGPNFGFHLVLTRFNLDFLSFWISRLFDLNKLRVLKNAKIFWKWPQIVKKFPNVNWRYESQGKVAFKSNVLSSEECDDCPWPSPPGTFHILIGKFSYLAFRCFNHIFLS